MIGSLSVSAAVLSAMQTFQIAKNGEEDAGYQQVDVAIEALADRRVDGRPVRPEALAEMEATRDSLRPKSRQGGRRSRERHPRSADGGSGRA